VTRSIVPTESALADRCGKAGRSHASVAATGRYWHIADLLDGILLCFADIASHEGSRFQANTANLVAALHSTDRVVWIYSR